MLLRLLLLTAVIWVVYRLFFHRPKQPRPRTEAVPYQDTVRCQECGLHLPADKALRSGEQWFCSAEHEEAARRR